MAQPADRAATRGGCECAAMNCGTHLLREAVGYCVVCGSFGCSDCVTEHEGSHYCRKHYAPIAKKLAEEQKHAALAAKTERQRLVAHLKTGAVHRGVCFAMNLKGEGFRLEHVDHYGEGADEATFIRFDELKALFYVKSFDGRVDPDAQHPEAAPGATEVVVEFADGEIMLGAAYHPFRPEERRFHLIPADPASNNVSVVVEKSATRAVMTPREYQEKRARELEAYMAEHSAPGVSEAELMGDFHIEHRELGRAVKQYKHAVEADPNSGRLKRKLSRAYHNLGVRFYRQHDHARAYSCIKHAVEADPENQQARQRYERIRAHLKKKRRREA